MMPAGVTPSTTVPVTTIELARQLQTLGFRTETDLLNAGFTTIGNFGDQLLDFTDPVKFPPPPTWAPIIVERFVYQLPPYTKYSAPADSIKRPEFLSSEGLSFQGDSGTGGGGGTGGSGVARILADGPLRQIFRNLLTPPIPPGPPAPPVDLTEIEADIAALEALLSRIDRVVVTFPDLDPLKSSILGNFDGLSLTNHDPNLSLVNIINRNDTNMSNAFRYSDLINAGLSRTIDRTNDLRTVQSEQQEAIEGLRILAQQAISEETVTGIAQREATLAANQTVGDAFKNFLNSTIFSVEADAWFDKQLSERGDIASAAEALKCCQQVRAPFMDGGTFNTARADDLRKLLVNTGPILDSVPRSREAWDELFTDEGLTSLRSRLDIPTDFEFDLTALSDASITDFMNRAKGIPPLDALPPFFRSVVGANVNNITPGYKDAFEGYTDLSLSMDKVKDILNDRDYTISTTFTFSDPTGAISSKSFISEFTHKGLLGMLTHATAWASSQFKSLDPGLPHTGRNRVEVARDIAGDVAGLWAGQLDPAFSDLGISSLSDMKDINFVTEAGLPNTWNKPFSDGLNNIFTGIGLIPDRVPLGWE